MNRIASGVRKLLVIGHRLIGQEIDRVIAAPIDDEWQDARNLRVMA